MNVLDIDRCSAREMDVRSTGRMLPEHYFGDASAHFAAGLIT